MKKRSLTLLSVLFAMCLLIFACRREINNLVGPRSKVSPELLESAKIFDAQTLSSSASINARTPDFINLKAQWDDARTIDAGKGYTYLVVPTAVPTISNRSMDIRRVFVFVARNNQVTSGKIIEFIGVNYRIKDQLDGLITNSFAEKLGDFNGAIIHYDLNYRWVQGGTYLKGVQVYGNTVAVRSASKDNSFYLAHFYANEQGGFDYAINPEMNVFSRQLRTADEGGDNGTGSLGGTVTVPGVTIPADPVGGNPGGTNPPPPDSPPAGNTGDTGTSTVDPSTVDTYTGDETDEPADDQPPVDPYYEVLHPRVNIVHSAAGVTILFGTTKDNLSADNAVSAAVVVTLYSALAEAHNLGVNSILIKATTNGYHTSANSNHYKGLAVDISMINGKAVAYLGNSALVQALQNALENQTYIRENFGPSFKHKNGVNFATTDGSDHIHFSVNVPHF